MKHTLLKTLLEAIPRTIVVTGAFMGIGLLLSLIGIIGFSLSGTSSGPPSLVGRVFVTLFVICYLPQALFNLPFFSVETIFAEFIYCYVITIIVTYGCRIFRAQSRR